MSKYRSLTSAEVKEFNKEFIDFLVLNGIVADDWEKMKNEKPEAAQGIIEAFSDVIFERILQQARYVERVSHNQFAAVACLAGNFHMIALKNDGSKNIDFTDEGVLLSSISSPSVEVNIYTSEKKYTTDRESEIWNLLEDGFNITDGNYYLQLIDQLGVEK